MVNNLSFWSVFLAGILSFLSPCVLPLVPPYLCYMGGVTIQNLRHGYGEDKRSYLRLIISSLAFIAGFTTIFVSLGMTASEIGLVLNKYRHILMILASIIIIIMGLNFLGILRIGFFFKEYRLFPENKEHNLWQSYLMGAAFAFGWTPCIGPILGAILSLASQKKNLLDGALLLSLYSLGLGIPFFLAALFSRWFMMILGKITGHLGYIEKLLGLLLILTGCLFLIAGETTIAQYISNVFPVL